MNVPQRQGNLVRVKTPCAPCVGENSRLRRGLMRVLDVLSVGNKAQDGRTNNK